MKTTIRCVSALLGLTLPLSACGSNDIQLEPALAALSAGEAAETSACFTVYTSLTSRDTEIFQIRVDGQALRWPSGGVMTVGGTNAETFCVSAGDHDFSLTLGSHTLGHTGLISTCAGDAIALAFYGTIEDAHVSWFEATDNEAGAGLRYTRITNLALDQMPVVLIYKTGQGDEVARSAPVAYGQTWHGTVPQTAIGWEYADSSVDHGYFNTSCDFKNTLGVVLLSDRAQGRQGYMPELLLPHGQCRYQEDATAID